MGIIGVKLDLLDGLEDLELAQDLLLGVRNKDGELIPSTPFESQELNPFQVFHPINSKRILTNVAISPCRDVSDDRGPDLLARADFGDNLEELSRLEMESSVALGDPCGVAAVCVMMTDDGFK